MKRRIIWLLAILGIAGAVWFIYYNATFRHLFLNDAMDYASIGRNIARGDGFISSYITPLSLANYKGLPHPDLWRAPLWPLILSIFIRLFGGTDQAVAIATGSFFVAGAAAIFLLGEELFDRKIGIMAAFIYIFSAQNLLNSVSGMTETVSAFLMVLAVYLIVASWAQNAWGDVLAGMVMGLFYLTRYNALLFVPFIALFLWYRRRGRYLNARGRLHSTGIPKSPVWSVARFLASFLIVVLPWLVRNYLLMSSPMFSLQKYEPAMFTATYPGYSLYMMFQKVNAVEFIKAHPQEIWAKVGSGWAEFRSGFFSPETTGVSAFLFIFFLLALVIPFGYRTGTQAITCPKRGFSGVRPLLVVCFLLQLAALLVIHFIYRLFYIFSPFYIIFGLAALVWILENAAGMLHVRKKGFVALGSLFLVGLAIAANLPSWEPLKPEETPIVTYRDSIKEVTNLSTRKDLIISNDGHLLAWYGDRYAAKLPYRVDMIPEVEKRAPLKFIYLSGRVSWNLPEGDKSWGRLFWSRPKNVYGFNLVKVFKDGSLLYRKQ